ncbi:putative beta-alanine synthase [Phaeomoniella chlamydospora]|uniref:Putative beta-alanine synthase n=1 Tax=Phaeomoniella chlamydospora TaxID=158046 RepID=A0A0G2ELG1_PHACM|nr:putative beta-alanine synthase [Phaeomoniella chlamydospora]
MGGRFDGILGVLSALEVIRTLRERGVSLTRPLVAIDWTNEEGARFPAMCTGSSVWAGTKSQEGLHELASLTEDGITMRRELERLKFLGEIPSSHKAIPLAAHFELHIEQAKRLERESKRVGVVTGIQGMRWYTVVIHGNEGHAGSTPMQDRQDALVAASKLVLEVEKEAKRVNGFGTVGFLKPRSDSTNTIIGEVRLAIDLRHPSESVLDEVEANFRQILKGLESETIGISSEFTRTWESEAVIFDAEAVDCVREAAAIVAGKDSCLTMYSCAGHDSAETARVIPTAMIFVPSKNGISHNPAEFTSQDQCVLEHETEADLSKYSADGAQTLLEAVLAYDKLLAARA